MLADYLTFTQVVEFFSLVIALLIAGYSFRAFIITKQRKHEYFALAFVMIGMGIAANILFNGAVRLADVAVPLRGLLPITTASSVLLFFSGLLRLAGYVTIFLITEELTNKKAVFLTFLFVTLTALLALDYYAVFHLVNFVVLVLIFGHFYRNFHVHGTKSSLLVMLAFGCLTLSQVPFSLVVVDYFFYQIGAFIRLISFIFFLSALVIIFKPRRTPHARA